MDLLFERRAKIALRSLQGVDLKKVERALQALQAAAPSELFRDPHIRKVSVGPDSTTLYVYGSGSGMRLRLIFAIEGEKCILLDIADHDRLERLLFQGAQR